MKLNIDGLTIKRGLRNSFYILSIFCVVNYISTSVHSGNSFIFVVLSGCLFVGFVFSLLNINLQDRKDERT